MLWYVHRMFCQLIRSESSEILQNFKPCLLENHQCTPKQTIPKARLSDRIPFGEVKSWMKWAFSYDKPAAKLLKNFTKFYLGNLDYCLPLQQFWGTVPNTLMQLLRHGTQNVSPFPYSSTPSSILFCQYRSPFPAGPNLNKQRFCGRFAVRLMGPIRPAFIFPQPTTKTESQQILLMQAQLLRKWSSNMMKHVDLNCVRLNWVETIYSYICVMNFFYVK